MAYGVTIFIEKIQILEEKKFFHFIFNNKTSLINKRSLVETISADAFSSKK